MTRGDVPGLNPEQLQELLVLKGQTDGELRLLEMLASGAALPTLLESFARHYESVFPGVKCSVLLLDDDGKHLRHGTGPSLPADYCAAIDGVAIGMGVGSCGTAAFTRKDTLVENIATDPLWKNFKDLAVAHGLQSCWSIPIISTRGKVLGTFANYYDTPRSPQANELQAIRRGAYLIGLAIEHRNTEKQLAADQAALRESALHRQAILDNMVDGVITIDQQGLVQSFNPAASTIFGYTADEMVGKNVSVLMPRPQRDEHDGYMRHFQNTGEARIIGNGRDVEGQHRDGRVFPISISVSKISRNGAPTFIGIVRDITKRRLDEEEIRRLAFYDPLTNLPNRRLLIDRVKQALVTAARTGQHGALMFLDLDHFKQLNDSLGHDVGDELLKQVAVRISACVREGDSVARLGGDEFVVLLEALSTNSHDAANQAEVVATKILGALGQSYSLHGHSHSSTPSIGIVIFLEENETIDEIVKKADVAMYQAKAAGRNTVRFFDPEMQAAAAARVSLERDVRSGLALGEFLLHYQLQVDAAGIPIGTEALVRWNHPLRGLVPPGDFISLAEETGLILPLGQWVLETACAQLVAWSRQSTTQHLKMSVNVSAVQFAQADFVAKVHLALHKTGANPALLKLELTESMLAHDVEDIIVKMNAIKTLGVGFSLDDFGTGYSSLTYLKRLPLSQLKIDQSFVGDLRNDANDAAIARTIVALGHSLGLNVIAEGVETTEQRDALLAFGCDAFQGYLYGKPVPAHALRLAPAR